MPIGKYPHKSNQGFQKGISKPVWNKGISGYTTARKGQKHSIEAKEKMRKNHKGMAGKHCSVDHKRKISDAQKNKPRLYQMGEKHWNWKGGITKEFKIIRQKIEYRLWREAVFARDNWTCQKTGKRGVKLHPHHIQNFAEYPELRFAIDNGITLSEQAHQDFHKKYGRSRNTVEQIKQFLLSK